MSNKIFLDISRYIGLFILLYIFFKIDLNELKNEITGINILPLLIAMGLNIPHLFIKSLRWNYLLRQQNICLTYWETFLPYMSSLYIGFITPGRVGEFIKAFYLKTYKGISLSRGFSSVLIDRLFDLYLLLILGSIGIWKFDILGKFSDAFLLLSALVILVPLIMFNKKLVMRMVKILYNFTVLNRIKGEIEGSFEDFFNGMYQLANLKLLVSVLYTCIGYFMFFIQCYLIVLAMDLSINFVSISLFMAISNLISFIPISISGLGTRDATLIFLFTIIGLKPEIAVSYSFLVFITFFLVSGLMGAFSMWVKPVFVQSKIA